MNRKTKMKIYSIAAATTPNSKSSVVRFCVRNVMFSLHMPSRDCRTMPICGYECSCENVNQKRKWMSKLRVQRSKVWGWQKGRIEQWC
jgi:hypothetical protein